MNKNSLPLAVVLTHQDASTPNATSATPATNWNPNWRLQVGLILPTLLTTVLAPPAIASKPSDVAKDWSPVIAQEAPQINAPSRSAALDFVPVPVVELTERPAVFEQRTFASTQRRTAASTVREPEINAQPNQQNIAQVDAAADETALLREQVRLLEARQASLEQELAALRDQVNAQANAIQANSTQAAAPPETDAETNPRQGLGVQFTGLLVNPSSSNIQDFAIVDPGTALVVGGSAATVTYDQTTALRYGLTYSLQDSGFDLGASRVTLSTSGTAIATAPPGGFLFATLAHPAQNERAETASADLDLEYAVTDLEVGYRVNTDSNLALRLFGGVRFASIDQDMTVRYDGVDFTNTEIVIDREFSGAGLRLGAQADLSIGSGFSLFGRAAGTLFSGSVSLRQRETDNNGLDEIASLRQEDTRIIPMLELAAGVQWDGQLNDSLRLHVATGYTLENWFNVNDSVRFVDSSGQGILTQNSGDLSLEGFFLELGLRLDF